MDKRVRKSREALAHSLTNRMREEPFGRIRGEDVARDAGVARSTFYARAGSTESLFFDMLDHVTGMLLVERLTLDAASGRPRLQTREFWDHIREQRALCDRLARDPGWARVTSHMEAFLAPRFAERLAVLEPVPRAREELALVGALLAGAVTGVLIAWYDGGMRLSPDALDALVAERVRL